jgi:hypothetical protein
LRPRALPFYALLALATWFGVARAVPGLTASISDWLLHGAGYAALLLTGSYAFLRRRALLFTGLFAYSIIMEIIQYFLPWRTFSVTDILANLAGLITASLLWSGYQQLRRYRNAAPATGRTGHEQG